MKEFLYEIATFFLAAVQAFWLVWVTGGICALKKPDFFVESTKERHKSNLWL